MMTTLPSTRLRLGEVTEVETMTWTRAHIAYTLHGYIRMHMIDCIIPSMKNTFFSAHALYTGIHESCMYTCTCIFGF